MANNHVTMLVGLPCTGKSTFISKLGYTTYDITDALDNTLILSTDYNVEQMGLADGITDYSAAWEKYVDLADKKFFDDLDLACAYGYDLIIDRTNLSVKARNRIFNVIRKYKHNTRVNADVFGFDLDPYAWIQRIAGRPDKVIPAHVLITMGKSFQMPTQQEGFANVYIK